jgi:exodeoxyribonuclease V alpha subunit
MSSDPNSDKKDDFISVEFDGVIKTYFGEEVSELKLAWCISVHKYQGSQSPYILLSMTSEASNMMSKELVYTAFTRAEKMLYVFGNDRLLRQAPHRSVVKKRFTNMVDFVDEYRNDKKIFNLLYKPCEREEDV